MASSLTGGRQQRPLHTAPRVSQDPTRRSASPANSIDSFELDPDRAERWEKAHGWDFLPADIPPSTTSSRYVRKLPQPVRTRSDYSGFDASKFQEEDQRSFSSWKTPLTHFSNGTEPTSPASGSTASARMRPVGRPVRPSLRELRAVSQVREAPSRMPSYKYEDQRWNPRAKGFETGMASELLTMKEILQQSRVSPPRGLEPTPAVRMEPKKEVRPRQSSQSQALETTLAVQVGPSRQVTQQRLLPQAGASKPAPAVQLQPSKDVRPRAASPPAIKLKKLAFMPLRRRSRQSTEQERKRAVTAPASPIVFSDAESTVNSYPPDIPRSRESRKPEVRNGGVDAFTLVSPELTEWRKEKTKYTGFDFVIRSAKPSMDRSNSRTPEGNAFIGCIPMDENGMKTFWNPE